MLSILLDVALLITQVVALQRMWTAADNLLFFVLAVYHHKAWAGGLMDRVGSAPCKERHRITVTNHDGRSSSCSAACRKRLGVNRVG